MTRLVFQLNEKVWWTTQGAGKKTQRAGLVVAIVPKGKRPTTKWNLRDPGGPRDHESYIVQVEGEQFDFWPAVVHLHRAEKENPAVTYDLLLLVEAQLPHGLPTLEQIASWSKDETDVVEHWAATEIYAANDCQVKRLPIPDALARMGTKV